MAILESVIILKLKSWLFTILPMTIRSEHPMKIDMIELLKIIIIPIIVGALSVWIMADRVAMGLQYHKEDESVHMNLQEKIKTFVLRSEFFAHEKKNEDHFHEVLAAIEKLDRR